MSCDKNRQTCQSNQAGFEQSCGRNGISEYLIIIVLYILLAIILSACLNF